MGRHRIIRSNFCPVCKALLDLITLRCRRCEPEYFGIKNTIVTQTYYEQKCVCGAKFWGKNEIEMNGRLNLHKEKCKTVKRRL